jgi:CubicO group peptidase (beta-lactamase class C family)
VSNSFIIVRVKIAQILFAFFCSQSLLAQPFAGLSEAIETGGYGNVKAVVISRHGEIIFEDYFLNTEPDDLHQVFSVTKSVGAALIGIAHRQGMIRLDQDLEDFFSGLYPMSQYPFWDKRFITVEQILQQRHGIEWDEFTVPYGYPGNSLYDATVSDDWYEYLLTLPMDAQPGAKFTYSTIASTLMSRMIRQVSSQGPRTFAIQKLFGPLDIEDIHWELFSNQGMGHGRTDWPNPDGDEPLGLGLWLKPVDMVKFGELYLNGGVYNGHRILDKSWVEASWQTHSQFNSPGSGYGYQWWISTTTDSRERTWKQYYALGWAHQYVLVFPELDLVVASVADDFNYDGPGIGALLRSIILPEISPNLDERFTGSWYDPITDGQGFNLHVINDGKRLIAYWYTYGEESSKRWFTMSGPITADEADVTIKQTSGGVFLQNDPVERSEWGTGHFSVIDCNHLGLEINSEEVHTTITLTRLTGSCESAQAE